MSCPRCATRFEPQVFGWDDGGALYNVQTAYLLAATYAPIELPNDIANEVLAINWSETFAPEHLAHVDLDLPAMAVTIDGQIGLIDGTHRLAERQARGLPLLVYILTEADSRLCELPRFVRRLLTATPAR